jgi:tetratricopeptide (TPR) repeat protein
MKPVYAQEFSSRLIAVAALAVLALSGGPVWAAAAAAPAVLTPDQIHKLLEDGAGVLKQGNPELAIKDYFEPVNQSFMHETAKAGANDEIYASHGASETAAYTSKIAKQNEGAKTPTKLVIVDGTWTDALVMKARALILLQRIPQARAALDMATTISPAYPTSWLVLASTYDTEKNWDKALATYKTAENFAGAVDDKAQQAEVLTAALRGQAVALTELGRLDEAAALYKRCLRVNKDDTAATEGLAHIAALGGPPVPAPAPAAPNPKSPPPKPH